MADYSSNALSNQSNDFMSSLFEPDVILPSQFLSSDEKGLTGGERKLMAAILSDGIEAYIAQTTSPIPEQRNPSTRSRKIDAAEWVETQDFTYVFSFDNVCECLGINPEYLRLGLARYVLAIRADRIRGIASQTVWKKIRRPRKH